jgi:phosphatidylserine synthase 2
MDYSKQNKEQQTKDIPKKHSSKRNVGMQTIVQTKEYMSPSVAVTHNLESVDYPKIVAIPHGILTLTLLCSLMFYLSRYSLGNFEESAQKGIMGAIICVLAFGCLYLPDSILRRPHPMFWRLILSSAILYLLFITFTSFQTTDNARAFLQFFDKNLGQPLPEKNYADNCEVTKPEFPYIKLDNFLDSVDFYMTAHLLGWYVKMLIIRDVKLCWFLSIFFEILEITFRHWLPNFWECWWDHAILDVFGMNALGIFLGDLTCKYFEMKNYKWIERNEYKEKSFKGRISKFVNYFTPNYYVKHDWNIFSSLKRFYAVLWYIVFLNLVDLSHFFMKYVLWIPPTHYILHIRIYLWGFLAIISTREYYEYVTNKSCKRLGHNVWLAHLILFVEWCCILKFSQNMFYEPFPVYVKYFWYCVFSLVALITIHLSVKDFIKYFKIGEYEEKLNFLEPKIEVETVEDKNDDKTD